MQSSKLTLKSIESKLILIFSGKLTIFTLEKYEKIIDDIDYISTKSLELNLDKLLFLDTAGAIFLNNIVKICKSKQIDINILCKNSETSDMIKLVNNQRLTYEAGLPQENRNIFYKLGKLIINYIVGLLSFMGFIGELFITRIRVLISIKNIRYKETAFAINDSGIKALGIIMLTSFLIGVVVAYQSAYQLKIYGANIFIVNMLGLSILRELAPIMTAIVIAGRSGSSYTAQIGAMKITQELDAMKTMGFDPFLFLVIPRIMALIIVMPILIFIADIMGMFGGMLISYSYLGINPEIFIERFNEVIAVKHFFVGIIKGPFFAFLIATISIYRGLAVQNDTQSIGYNTTKSVVAAIFAVIVCDAIFSIIFTNLGI